MKFLALLVMLPTLAFANPVNKLCRSSTQVQTMYGELRKESAALALKGLCFHAGRVAGAIEDGMTFRDRAREKTPPDLLVLADRMVADALAIAAYCKTAGSDDARTRAELDAALETLVGPASRNAEIAKKACDAEN